MKLKHDKCLFFCQKWYLGHVISSAGLQPSEAKVAAITGALAPTNVTELKSFFGLVNYYAKFSPILPLFLLICTSYCVKK